MTKCWNHNIHYHPVLLGQLPAGAGDALDVGCGTGMLTRQLRERIPHVIGIDRHPPSIDHARDHCSRPGLDYLLGDFLTYPFKPASFDVIVSVAALHHMNATTALMRMRELLRPGGMLGIIGLARSDLPADLPRELAAIAVDRCYLLTRTHRLLRRPAGCGPPSSPTMWPPPHTYREMHRIAGELLPGSGYRRHLRRYTPNYAPTWPCGSTNAPTGPAPTPARRCCSTAAAGGCRSAARAASFSPSPATPDSATA